MKKILTIISGTALAAAAVLAVVALTTRGEAAAQESTSPTTTQVDGLLSEEAVTTLSSLADDLIDTLVSQDVISADQADEARTALDDAQSKFEELDRDMVNKQLELVVARIKSEAANANWNNVRDRIEDAIGNLDDTDLGEFDFNVDSIDWSELEKGFDDFKAEVQSFDLDEATQELERALADVDWDKLSEEMHRHLAEIDFNAMKDRIDQLKKQFSS